MVVEYESLAENCVETLREVFRFLDLDAPETFPDAGIKRQATSLNLEWESEFRNRTHRA